MYTLYTTMLINLKKTEEELWEQIGNLRTDVRKATKNEITISTEPTLEEKQEAYTLYLKMMKDRYLPVEKNYSLNGGGKPLIIAKKDGKVISYIIFAIGSGTDVLGKTKICALETIATDDEYKSLSPNTLLYWEGIKYVKSLGFEYLNFNGVSYEFGGLELNSLSFFKRKWNGIEIEGASKKSVLDYIYWRWFRKYNFVKKIVYKTLLFIFPDKYLKY